MADPMEEEIIILQFSYIFRAPCTNTVRRCEYLRIYRTYLNSVFCNVVEYSLLQFLHFGISEGIRFSNDGDNIDFLVQPFHKFDIDLPQTANLSIRYMHIKMNFG